MEQLFNRYRSLSLLVALIFGQLIMLAYQVRRPDAGGVSLLRSWGINAILPLEKASHGVIAGIRDAIHDYVNLREVREENAQLKKRVGDLQLENIRLHESQAEFAHLAALLDFKRSYIDRTLSAEVIGSGASVESQIVYINRGARDGIAQNMPVITPDGVVGKVTAVLKGAAQVLLITDPDSGVGALVEGSRIHGSLRGVRPGLCELKFVVNEDDVPVGAKVVTSGEDQIYPKGLPLGVITDSRPGDMFRHIEVRPSVQLGRVEELLVITHMVQRAPEAPEAAALATAAQIREQRLPSVPDDPLFPKTGEPPRADEIQAAERARRKQQAAAQAQAMQSKNAPGVAEEAGKRHNPTPVAADETALHSAAHTGVTADGVAPARTSTEAAAGKRKPKAPPAAQPLSPQSLDTGKTSSTQSKSPTESNEESVSATDQAPNAPPQASSPSGSSMAAAPNEPTGHASQPARPDASPSTTPPDTSQQPSDNPSTPPPHR